MRAPLDTDVAIETPEHIVFQYRIAGPARRALAQLLDLFLCYAAVVVVGLVVLVAFVGTGEIAQAGQAGVGLILLVLFAAQWIYFVAWEGATGRSPGKMALGLRVVTANGRPIRYRAAALRNLLRAADILPIAYVVGVVTMSITSRFQRLGDLVAGTMVIIPERASQARAVELSPPIDANELMNLPDDVVLDADERAALELFLRRRHSLGRGREQELAGMVAPLFAERLGYRHPDASRMLAIVYDRAANAGRTDAPMGSWKGAAAAPFSWRGQAAPPASSKRKLL